MARRASAVVRRSEWRRGENDGDEYAENEGGAGSGRTSGEIR